MNIFTRMWFTSLKGNECFRFLLGWYIFSKAASLNTFLNDNSHALSGINMFVPSLWVFIYIYLDLCRIQRPATVICHPRWKPTQELDRTVTVGCSLGAWLESATDSIAVRCATNESYCDSNGAYLLHMFRVKGKLGSRKRKRSLISLVKKIQKYLTPLFCMTKYCSTCCLVYPIEREIWLVCLFSHKCVWKALNKVIQAKKTCFPTWKNIYVNICSSQE